MVLAGLSVLCSFAFGWSIAWPFWVVMALGLFYAFTTIGDSPSAFRRSNGGGQPLLRGPPLGSRSMLGFGLQALSRPSCSELSWTGRDPGQQAYTTWGWAFVSLGIPGLGAVWAARRLHPSPRP